MRLGPVLAASAMLAGGTLSVAAAVPDGCHVALENDPSSAADDVSVCPLQTYLAAPDATASDPSDPRVPHATFDETAPDASVTAGGGAGSFGSGAVRQAGQRAASSLHLEGEFTGVIDVMDLDLHVIAPFQPDDIALTVEIDGVQVVDPSIQRTISYEHARDIAPRFTFRQGFAVTGIARQMQLAGLDLSADAAHTVRVHIEPWMFDSGNWVWLYDATEVPSAISFNPPELDPDVAVVPAG